MLYEKVSKRTPQQAGQALERTWLQSVAARLKSLCENSVFASGHDFSHAVTHLK